MYTADTRARPLLFQSLTTLVVAYAWVRSKRNFAARGANARNSDITAKFPRRVKRAKSRPNVRNTDSCTVHFFPCGSLRSPHDATANTNTDHARNSLGTYLAADWPFLVFTYRRSAARPSAVRASSCQASVQRMAAAAKAKRAAREAEAEAASAAAADDEVEFAGERTREQRDAELRAHAVEVDV